MRTFSRVGVLPITVFLQAAAALPAAPSDPDPATIPLHDVNADETTDLRAFHGSLVALHFIGPLDAEQRAALVRETLEHAPAVAGVRHVFVHADPLEEARQWLESIERDLPAARILHDEDGALSTALAAVAGEGPETPTLPWVYVLEADGTYLFSQSDDPADPRRLRLFADRMRERSRTQAIDHYNTPRRSNLAVEGYDLVAYHTRNRAVRGSEQHTSEYRGLQYRFSSAENRAAFAEDPERYLPTYGGWCASAMGDGGRKVEVSPTSFKIQDGRLHLFYKDMFSNALSDWNRHPEWEAQADDHWQRIASEEPRTQGAARQPQAPQ